MYSALHRYHGLASELADDEITFVPDGRGYRKSRDVPVRHHDRVFYLLCQFAKSAPEYYPDNRLTPLKAALYIFSRFENGRSAGVVTVPYCSKE